MSIKLKKETEERLIISIKRYFTEKLDEDIGELKASLVLEYFLKEIAPTIYNIAIGDAQAYINERISDIEGTCYEQEFTYWKR
jgi:uncharacterized protein (DUF2164 family)